MKAYRVYVLSIGSIALMAALVWLFSPDPDMASPKQTFAAVMEALRTHDQPALHRLTTPKGYRVLSSHMVDETPASYTKLYDAVQEMIKGHHVNLSGLDEGAKLHPLRLFNNAKTLASLPNPRLVFRRSIKGWKLDDLRSYDLDPLIRKEKGVPVLPPTDNSYQSDSDY